jgi:flavin-binding protein dodecin
MAVARVTEIIAGSQKGYEDAVAAGIKRAAKTLKNVRSAWVDGTEVIVDDKGKIAEWRVHMKVTFILEN